MFIYFLYLKIHEIVIARWRVQYYMNVCHKHYKHFELKRSYPKHNVLDERECASRTLHRF